MMVVVVLNDDEVFLCNHQVFPIDLAEDFWFEDIGGRPCGVEAGLEEHEPVHPRTDHIDVMGDQEDRQAQVLRADAATNSIDVVLGRDIQSGRRFIEQEYFWLLGQRPAR